MSFFDEMWKKYLSTPNRRSFGEFDGWLVDQVKQIKTDRDHLYEANGEFVKDVKALKDEIERLTRLNSELLRNCSDLIDALDNLDQADSYSGVRKRAHVILDTSVNSDSIKIGSDGVG